VIVVGLLISNHNVEVMRFSGNQSQVFAINGSSRDYFLEPVSQTNLNLCRDPTIVSLYRQGDTAPSTMARSLTPSPSLEAKTAFGNSTGIRCFSETV